jgi:CubicO group peptidase (beta-lactamase class C family)
VTYSWRSLAVLVAAVLMAACGTSTAPAPPAGPGGAPGGQEAAVDAGPLPPATVAGIEQIVRDQMRTGAVPGMAVGVWLPGQGRLVRAYGVADVASGAPFAVDDHVRIASITKTFTAGQPGSWQYSDSNYILLGQIIERAAGEPAGTFIEREIVDILSLPGTSYPTSPEIPPPSARGYLVVPPGAPERDVTVLDPAVAGPAGAMISTVDGLRAWADALATGRLLTPAAHTEQTTFVNANLSPTLRTGYGAGLFEMNDFVGHNGAIYGFNTAMFQLPQTGATIVVVANRSSNVEGVGLETFLQVAKLLYPDRFSS